jgi:hypothetical protein
MPLFSESNYRGSSSFFICMTNVLFLSKFLSVISITVIRLKSAYY